MNRATVYLMVTRFKRFKSRADNKAAKSSKDYSILYTTVYIKVQGINRV